MVITDLAPLRRAVIDAVAEKLLMAVKGDMVVHLKDKEEAFDFQKTVTYCFDDFEITIYVEGYGGDPDPEDIMDGNIRYVESAELPDGRSYKSSSYGYLENPFDVFLKRGGDSDKLEEILQNAK